MVVVWLFCLFVCLLVDIVDCIGGGWFVVFIGCFECWWTLFVGLVIDVCLLVG